MYRRSWWRAAATGCASSPSGIDGFEVLEADLGTPDGLAATVARVRSADDPIDLVVNNAGFGTSGIFRELDADRLDAEVRLNIAALPATVARRAGDDGAPRSRVPAQRVLHEEMRGTGVHVTALCPGLTKTEFQSVSNTSGYERELPSFAWMSAQSVAATGLRDVAENRAISVPGLLYRATTTVADVTPRWLTRRISGLIANR